MHLGKTRVMFNEHAKKCTTTVNGETIKEVDSYVDLGKTVTKDGDLLPEIRRRIAPGWAAFGKVDNIIRSRKVSIKIERKIHDEYILPVMTWLPDTSPSRSKAKRLVSQETGMRDIINAIRKAKHRWAGHIARPSDNRWTIRATEWTPRGWTRKQGRPRWRDDLSRQFGPVWLRLAKHRHLWDQFRGGSSVKSDYKPWWWWWSFLWL